MPQQMHPRDVTHDRSADGAGVVVIGDALIDELRGGGDTREFVGGAALNVAVGLSILGVRTTLVAMVGDDAEGARIREFLDDHGVALLASPAPLGSSRAVSDRRAGEPVYAFNAAAQARHIDFDEPSIHRAIATADYVVISCFPFDDQRQVEALSTAIAGRERSLILDPNPRLGMMHDRDRFVRSFEALAGMALVTKVGDEDATVLGYASLRELAQRVIELGSQFVVTTAGAAGAWVGSRHGLDVSVPIRTLEDPIVDTMGAGDATLATIAASIAQAGVPQNSERWALTLDDAMLVAAATCRAEGALLRMPEHFTPARIDAPHPQP